MTAPDIDRSVIDGWLRAAADGPVARSLESVYAQIAAQVDTRRPVCRTSGRCCRFEEYGHRLYVTGLEAAYTLLRAAAPARDAGGPLRLPVLPSGGDVGTAGCRFQEGGLCTVHTVRPLGCRVYYCDESAQEWQQGVSEGALREVRAIHERFGVEYRYMEWRALLAAFDASGALTS